MHSIASFLLMASVLLSSTGIRFSQHWCGEKLVNTSVFGKAQPCNHYQAAEKPACPFHSAKESSKDCCSQREAVIEGKEYDFEVQVTNAPLPDQVITWNLPLLYLVNFDDQEYKAPKFFNHSPPLIGSSIRVRIQSFLI